MNEHNVSLSFKSNETEVSLNMGPEHDSSWGVVHKMIFNHDDWASYVEQINKIDALIREDKIRGGQ